jgi:quercetin dioxygenase-like cupin family protein
MVITLDIPPGAARPAPPPGHHVFGYVLEGGYKLKLDQGTKNPLGQTFYEARGQLHAVSANASATEPAKVLAVIVAESGKPLPSQKAVAGAARGARHCFLLATLPP